MAKKNLVDATLGDVDGRKNPREKRPVYFYGVPAGVKLVKVEMPGEKWSQKEAEDKLKAALGQDCQIVGPNYRVVGGLKDKLESITVKIDMRDIRFTAKRFSGDHENWTFYANGVGACTVDGEKFEDNDLVQIQGFDDKIDSSLKTKKPRLSRQMVRRESLDNIVEI
jgi:hypothetical protein